MTIRKQLWLVFVPAMLLSMLWGEPALAKSQKVQSSQTTKAASSPPSGPVPIPYPLGGRRDPATGQATGKRQHGNFR